MVGGGAGLREKWGGESELAGLALRGTAEGGCPHMSCSRLHQYHWNLGDGGDGAFGADE